MENQHRKIAGYRELLQAEIDLMNRIKLHGEATKALIADVDEHLHLQDLAAARDLMEAERIQEAQPKRWLNIAKTDFQSGYMALVRAVAQPTTF